MIRSILFLGIYLLLLSCCQSQNPKEAQQNINFQVNFNVINKDGKEEKEILAFWQNYLNSEDLVRNHENDWITRKGFEWSAINLIDFRKIAQGEQATVIALNKKGDFYRIKTMLSKYNDSLKINTLNFIFNTYVKKINKQWKLFSASEYMMNNLEHQKLGSIDFYYNSKHHFNKKNAAKTDSLNHFLAKQFNLQVIDFQYIVCENREEVERARGYDFAPIQFAPSDYAGCADTHNKIIFAGNDSEFYPHEQVHLYTFQYARNKGAAYHHWGDEGIASLFGGNGGVALEENLKLLAAHFRSTNTTSLPNDINALDRPLKDGSLISYHYSLGGLICKKIYEKEGMNGLLDFFITADDSDAAYYAAVKKHLGISKSEFGEKMLEMVLEF